MRITWFGGQCVRASLGDTSLCFFPDSAAPLFRKSELLANAIEVNENEVGPFVPYSGPKRENSERLIDVIDNPDRTFLDDGCFLASAEPDEKLLFVPSGGHCPDAFKDEMEAAVFLIEGAFEEVAKTLSALIETKPRQCLLIVSDLENLDMQSLAKTVGKTPTQLLEIGLAVEL